LAGAICSQKNRSTSDSLIRIHTPSLAIKDRLRILKQCAAGERRSSHAAQQAMQQSRFLETVLSPRAQTRDVVAIRERDL
jgi:hypothetical protein